MNEEKISPRLLCAVAAAALMSFCGVVSETAMNVTFPTLMKELGVGTSTVQWLTTGYLLILSLVIPLSSFLKKRVSAKPLFLTAAALFIGGTLVCVFAPGFGMLLLGRLLQGAGTGIALPLMFNIILAQAPRSKIGLMMGIASLICAMAPAVGPVLGGFVVEAYGWRMIFIVLLPLLLIALGLGATAITPIGEKENEPFDAPAYLLVAVGFTAFIFATEQSSSYGWLSVNVLGLFAVAAVALAAFAVKSLRSATPLVNLQVFRNKAFVCALVFILITQFNVLSLGYLIPSYAQLVSHSSTTIAGMLLLPGCLVGAAIAPVSGQMFDRLGAKKPILTGAVLLIISTFLFGSYSHQLTTALFMGFYVVFTLGQGFGVGNSMTYGLSQLPKEQSADGNAVVNTLQQLSGAVGTSVCAGIVAAAQNARPDDLAAATMTGSSHAFWLLAVLAVIGALSVWTALGQNKA
ncbi:EmrB/QacA subfamily drug resistance transporter [Neisseria perflava]|uniref:MDR family MFS transporter n=1 Tax=Neisseria perflava TaxID=33053 RepID=UPI00209E7203|nr:MDR family MFS transporter [Neisseria perflava]MCP1772051.1 EmrB/QacA subfamily drug resistance transporter [Neisseria perflava]